MRPGKGYRTNSKGGKIKVLQIVEDLKVGGLERVIQSLAYGLPLDKYEVQVWCLTKGGVVADELCKAGVQVEILGMGTKCTLRFLWELRGRMRRSGAQVVHCHAYTANTIGRTAAFLAGVPVIISHEHSYIKKYPFMRLIRERVLALITGRVLCCSSAVAEAVSAAYGLSSSKAAVVYSGAEDMRRPGGREDRFGLPSGAFVVGVAASMVPNKGYSVFLRAFREVVGVYPGARALLAGDGPLRADLESEAAELGIGGDVLFTGTLSEMTSFYPAIDLLVQASLEREGLSLSIVEAMSAGVPAVGSRLGGIPEAISGGVTGELVAPGDTAALAAAIKSFISEPGKLERMGLAARARYEKIFTRRQMTDAVSGIYNELLR